MLNIGSSYAHSSDENASMTSASSTVHSRLLVFLTRVRILRSRTNLSILEIANMAKAKKKGKKKASKKK